MSACPVVLCRCAAALLCCVGMCASAGQNAAPTVTLYAEDYPPFSWADKVSGKATGLSADIVNELMARAGVPSTAAQIAPWARAMVLTATTPNSCLYTTARVPEREEHFQWIGPIGHNEWVLFARRQDHIVLHSVDDARPYRIGTFLGDASVTFLKERKLQVYATPTDRLNPGKLQMQRIELWSVGRLPGTYLLRELGISDVEPVLTFAQADMYLACQRDMDRDEVTHLNEVLRAMYRDGTVRRIYAKYGYEKEAPRLDAP